MCLLWRWWLFSSHLHDRANKRAPFYHSKRPHHLETWAQSLDDTTHPNNEYMLAVTKQANSVLLLRITPYSCSLEFQIPQIPQIVRLVRAFLFLPSGRSREPEPLNSVNRFYISTTTLTNKTALISQMVAINTLELYGSKLMLNNMFV